MSTELEKLLQGGVQQQTPVVEMVTLMQLAFALERRDDGGVTLHFDQVLGPMAARRYSVPFSAEGWATFRLQIASLGQVEQ